MKPFAAFLGPVVGLVVGAILFFTSGEAPAIVALVGISAASFVVATYTPRPIVAVLLFTEFAVLVWGGLYIYDTTTTIVQALTEVEGPAAPADVADLAAAERALEAASDSAGFRIVLHEDEITAVVQDGLRDAEVPLRTIAIDIVESDGSTGTVAFAGEFKSGEVDVSGLARIEAKEGAINVDVLDVELGDLDLPGIAEGAIDDAIDDLLTQVSDLESLIAKNGAEVQSIEFGLNQIIVTGTQAGGDLLTSAVLLSSLGQEAASIGNAVEPPPERLGAGRIDGLFAPGDVFYVALGDSLAANVGVDADRDGYVSRLHNQLEIRDNAEYGLRNFGISGETTGTLLNGGQLEEAIAFLDQNPAEYITIDIGANDLLGHLGSEDCSEDLETPACEARLTATFASYEVNLDTILAELRDAAPDATIVFLQAYNPFSLGFGASVGLELTSTETLRDYNELAAQVAARHEILVADGFTPMLDTTAATTHMLDTEPDIHPNASGYDILTVALVEAIEGAR